jgi:hypothetical protein
MNDRRYSFRDLRSRFHVDTLQRDFYGEYDTSLNTRRWTFRTAEDCLNAQKFLAQYDIHALHMPGAHEAHRQLLDLGGRKIIAHNAPGDDDARSVKRGVDFYVFPSADARFEASALLRRRLAAPPSVVSALDSALKSAPDDTFSTTTPARLRERLASVPLTMHEVETFKARIEAAQKSRPSSAAALADDRAQTVASATATCERLHFEQFRLEQDAPAGDIVGLLVGRGAHHLAIQTNDDGRGMLCERWTISTPLRHQYAVEKSFDVGAAIHIRRGDQGGDALQLRGERDFHYGSLVLHAQRAAQERGFLPIVESEDLREADCNGVMVAHDDLTGAVLDDGAFITIGALDNFGGITSGHIRVGPTYFYAPKSYARSSPSR